MKLPSPFEQGFSPYRDPEPWAEFYDDFARRGTTAISAALAVHFAIFIFLQPSFRMPDIQEPEPEAIPVQIVAFEETEPEPEPEPAPIELRPATPAPAQAPRVKPKPQPRPQPQPTPPPPQPQPEPEPVVEPEPEPEITPPPPPPDILASQTPAPTENTVPEPEPIPQPIEPVLEPELQPVPEPIIQESLPEPIPQPVQPQELDVEIFDTPIDPDPVIESEPIEEPIIEPVTEPDPVIEPDPEPILEPEPELEPVPDPIEAIIEPEPEIEEVETFTTPDPEPTDPVPGIVTPEPVVEPVPEDVEVSVPSEIETEELSPPTAPVETEQTEPDPSDAAPIITTAPTILASPDAPTTAEEADRAVPQSQANPMFDPLQRPARGGGTGAQRPGSPGSGSAGSLGGPSRGGGNNIPSGTPRQSPGAGGWTLNPNSYGNSPGEGYGGMIEDIRCREQDRTHEDCPEYMRKHQGRNNQGFESFGSHSIGRTTTSAPRAGTQSNQAIGGGSNPWSQAIGSNSVNAGGPSESVIDDADFGREFLSTPLGSESQDGRLRDLFNSPTDPWKDPQVLTLPPPEDDDQNSGSGN